MRCSLLPRVIPTAHQAFSGASMTRASSIQNISLFKSARSLMPPTRPTPHAGRILEQSVNPTSQKKIPPQSRTLSRPFVGPPSKTPEQLATLPTLSDEPPTPGMPIYRRWMSGGNRIIILLKKVEGNRLKLVEDLAKVLQIERENIRLNPLTQHIEIKGDHYDETMRWLVETGF